MLFLFASTMSAFFFTRCCNRYSCNISNQRLMSLYATGASQRLPFKNVFGYWHTGTVPSTFHGVQLTETSMNVVHSKKIHFESKKQLMDVTGSIIEGTVQQVVFESKETQYSVLEVLVHRSSIEELEGKTIHVVGHLGAEACQSLISVEGTLTESKRYGKQFRIKGKKLDKKGSGHKPNIVDVQRSTGETEAIEIKVERILYTPGNASRYAVMQCVQIATLQDSSQASDSPDVVTVVSYFGPLESGTTVVVRGKWIHHEKYGLQFHAKSYFEGQSSLSVKEKEEKWLLETIESYLSSHTVPGIGPVLAKRLCSYFGSRVEDVLEEGKVEKLLHVRGKNFAVRQKSALALIDHFKEKGTLRKATLGLMNLGFPLSLVSRILKNYGIRRSLFLVENDPYILVEDLKGVGFKKIDRIARSLNPKFTIGRYRAAIKLALRAAVKEGHSFLYLFASTASAKQYETSLSLSYQLINDDLEEDAQFDDSLFIKALEELKSCGAVILCSMDDTTCVYLKQMYDYELCLGTLLKSCRVGPAKSLCDSLFVTQEDLSLEQMRAVQEAVFSDNQLCIITGGPGSGKTYTARRIVEYWKAKYGSNNIALAAPTGRAAARLAECTGLVAQTIHRLLEYQPRGESRGVFKRTKKRPLDVAAVLVDEFSMVDIEMAFSLLNALKPETKVVLIGDMFQLPSVGPGQVLRDICSSDKYSVVHLATNFRQQMQRSSLVEAASQIRNGFVPNITTYSASDMLDMYKSNSLSAFFAQLQTDLIMIEEEDSSEAVALLQRLVDRDVWSPSNISPYHDIQIISPGTKGSVGTIHLNRSLRQLLNPMAVNHEEHYFMTGTSSLSLQVGDKVFQKVNDYDRDVFNGDIGIVERLEKHPRSSEEVVHVRFMDRIVKYSSADDVVHNLSHAYALTVHKSQGSEFPVVFVFLFPMHYALFSRSLLYTAITRAKKLCVIIGTKRALTICVKQSKELRRNSLLPRLLGLKIYSKLGLCMKTSLDPAPIGNQVFAFERINNFDKQIEEDLNSPGSSTDLCPLFFSKSGCKKGSWCPYRHARNDRLIVCKHWLRGLCKKAEYCEYLHEYDMSKMPECYFFSKFGECSNTECLYRHVDPESRRNECPYYARGFCRHGAKCRYRHIKKVACPAYLRGFCKDGPNCKFGHAKFEIPRLDDEDSDPYGFGRPRGKGPVPFFNLDSQKWSNSANGNDSYPNQSKGSQDSRRVQQPEEEENKKNRHSGQIVCHLCGTPGHIKPRCPLRNMLQRK